jgi:4-carboxymuconolactone decarboxylase
MPSPCWRTPRPRAVPLLTVLALLTETVLSPKLRELVILRVAQRSDGLYVWSQHVAIARTVGVTDTHIAALGRGEAPAGLFTDRERRTLAFADDVLERPCCSDHTLAAVRELFSAREIVELVLLIGYFRMISGLMTTPDVELEAPFGVKILESARGKNHANARQQE